MCMARGRAGRAGKVDEDRWTPLHGAACFGEVAVVRELVEHGANLLATNAENDMPLDIAVEEHTRQYLTGTGTLFGASGGGGLEAQSYAPLPHTHVARPTVAVADALAARLQAPQLYALYDYDGLDEDELSFRRCDVLRITATDAERAEDGWWDAEDDTGRAGLVPSNYLGVRLVTADLGTGDGSGDE